MVRKNPRAKEKPLGGSARGLMTTLVRGASRRRLRVAISLAGLVAIAALIWFAGPLIPFGSDYPLEEAGPRLALVLLVLAAVGGAAAWRWWRRKQAADALVRGLSVEDSDAPVLAERMQAALSTLRENRAGRASYLYDLPWYVLIGPPGSGKTTALVNCGLEFPLAKGASPAAIAGIGGTRYCDWWFTDDAVLIDTAGRYTTQDSDAQADQKSWLAFLDLLKRNRPRQPINGVLVAISLEDVLTSSETEIAAHADAIRARLIDLQRHLKVDFPVYALFTKADLVIGFMEYFADLDEAGRAQVWGTTFQTKDKTRTFIDDVPAEFEALVERLNLSLPKRLETERDAAGRVMSFGFPMQMAALKGPVTSFLTRIFDPAVYKVNAALRGFYFTSGTQQGTPIDQLLGALTKSFGTRGVAAPVFSGQGKSFFLGDLVKDVVIGEAGWVSIRRGNQVVRLAAYAVLAVLAPVFVGLCWMAYARNSDLLAQSDAATAQYKSLAEPLVAPATVGDHDLAKILPALHTLRYMPGGYADTVSAAKPMNFGLSQSERMRSAAETAYAAGLERLMRPRLVQRLEEQLEANANDPAFLFDALKVYLMLGGLAAVDQQLIVSWMQHDWSANLYPGPRNADGRRELEQHLAALLDLGSGRNPLVTLNGPLVERTQTALARIDVAQRGFDALAARAKASLRDDWSAAKTGTASALSVFNDRLADVRVPYFFTRAGFEQALAAQLAGMVAEARRDRWVLGRAADQPAVAAQYDKLQGRILDVYAQAFVAAWRGALVKLDVRDLTIQRPAYPLLTAAASINSPLSRVLEAVRDETMLTRNPSGGDTETGLGTPAAIAIVSALRPFYQLVEGAPGRRPIDTYISSLNDIRTTLSRLATNTGQTDQFASRITSAVDRLRQDSTRLPPPFSAIFAKIASDVSRESADAAAARIVQAMREKITFACEDVIASRYPFSKSTANDVSLGDFARMFAPNGLFDRFMSDNVMASVDTSGSDWKWRGDVALARQLAPSALASFQRAAEFRDGFFVSESGSPTFSVSVTPPAAANMRLEVDRVAVTSRGNETVQWPGTGDQHRAALVVDNRPVIEQRGTWALFRLLDTARLAPDGMQATFSLGGRDMTYRFAGNGNARPLNINALRAFRCPTGI